MKKFLVILVLFLVIVGPFVLSVATRPVVLYTPDGEIVGYGYLTLTGYQPQPIPDQVGPGCNRFYVNR